jgi:tetratricopeptide (TPR) repeat protein
LLFENGAFEDAIQAYENGEIGETLSNYDVYLTRCKTYFLLGKIEEAIEDLKVCCRLKPEESYVRFDLSVI